MPYCHECFVMINEGTEKCPKCGAKIKKLDFEISGFQKMKMMTPNKVEREIQKMDKKIERDIQKIESKKTKQKNKTKKQNKHPGRKERLIRIFGGLGIFILSVSLVFGFYALGSTRVWEEGNTSYASESDKSLELTNPNPILGNSYTLYAYITYTVHGLYDNGGIVWFYHVDTGKNFSFVFDISSSSYQYHEYVSASTTWVMPTGRYIITWDLRGGCSLKLMHCGIFHDKNDADQGSHMLFVFIVGLFSSIIAMMGIAISIGGLFNMHVIKGRDY